MSQLSLYSSCRRRISVRSISELGRTPILGTATHRQAIAPATLHGGRSTTAVSSLLMQNPIRTLFSTTHASKLHLASRRTYASKSTANMSDFTVQKLSDGNGTDYPQNGDTVTMEYTGWLHDPSADNNRGKQFDSSVGRGDFKTRIGVGQVIQGWDQGVPRMSLGERAVLTIPGHMAYGDRGYPGLIPSNATLIFEVQLKGINNKKM